MDLSLQLYGRKLNRHCPRCLVDETKQNPYANSGSAESPEFDTMYLLLHNVFNFQFHTNKYWSEFHQKLLDLFIHWQWSIFAWAAYLPRMYQHIVLFRFCLDIKLPESPGNSAKSFRLDKILFAEEQKRNWIEKLQVEERFRGRGNKKTSTATKFPSSLILHKKAAARLCWWVGEEVLRQIHEVGRFLLRVENYYIRRRETSVLARRGRPVEE